MQIDQPQGTQDDPQGRVDMQAISVNWERIYQQQSIIGSRGVHLYMMLRSCCTRRNPHVAIASISEIAELMGWSEQNVLRYLRLLEKAELIKRTPNFDESGRPKANSYQLLA